MSIRVRLVRGTGQDGTTFYCPTFGALLAWDGTGQGGTKTTKFCPTQNSRTRLSHDMGQVQKDYFTL